jgi:Flp pilus assembly protein TadD
VRSLFRRCGLWWGLCLLPALHAAPAPVVTFNRSIAPILYKNCAPCHRPGESGPFSLLTYTDAKKHATQIASVTKKHFMPPWLPEAGYGDFQDERRLTAREIALIGQWVQQGAIEGTGQAPAPPKFSSQWELGPPDVILHVTHPYQLAPNSEEIFWNFIMPVPINTERWVRAIEVRPGNPQAFHHANVIIDRSGSAARQEKLAGIGFPGMDLSVEETTFDPDGHFLSWKPGTGAVVEPDGMAWRATPGMDLVLNVHLRPTGKQEIIDPVIGVYFTDKPQVKFPMLIQLEHDGALDMKPGDKDFIVTDDFRCPEDLNVLAVYPHAHYLAKVMEGYATLPDGTKKWLVRINDWDFSWQGVFRFKKPMFLPKGTVVSMRYHYDNSAENVRNPNRPPKEVKGGVRSTDEMGHLWLQVLPTAEGDERATLQQALVEGRLHKYPDDFSANYQMGDILLTKGDAPDAVTYLEKAVLAKPDSELGPAELGVAYFTENKFPEAEEQFRKALKIDPNFVDVRFNLASVEGEVGDLATSVKDFEEVLAERPDYPKAGERLGDVLFAFGDELAKSGDNQDAILRYRESLKFRADDVALRTSLGAALARLGHMDEARSEIQKALEINPNFEPAKQLLTAIGR